MIMKSNYFRANNIKCVNKKLKEKGAKVALIDIRLFPKCCSIEINKTRKNKSFHSKTVWKFIIGKIYLVFAKHLFLTRETTFNCAVYSIFFFFGQEAISSVIALFLQLVCFFAFR